MNTKLQLAMRDAFRFQNRAMAFRFATGAEKPLGVMLGDDGRFWVTTLANCERLNNAGYEWA